MHAAVRSAPLRRATVPSSLGPVVVHYRDAGPGQAPGQATDVYLHGAAGSWTTFAPLLEQDPAGGRAVVLIDLPGWGETTAAPGWDRVDISTMADAVTEVLLGMGHQLWGLVGHSMGGFLALHLAATRPQHTMSVAVLSGTTFAAARAARHPVRGMLEFPAFTGMFLVMRSLAAMGRTGRWLVAAVGRTRGLDLLMAPFFADPSSVPQTVIRNLAADARPSSFSAAAR
ncbi:MAG: alpha/beta fold hydrolase, partial [Actinomycetales bacterium]